MENKIKRPLISTALKKLTHSEELVIKYINHYPDKVFDLTQKELAQKSFSSEPTISRLIKKLGYKSYKEFAYKINFRLVEINQQYPIYKEKNILDIAKNIINLHMYAAASGIDKKNISQLEELSKIIDKKSRIIIWGVGASNKAAQEMTSNLQRIGIVAYCPIDFHVLLPIIDSFGPKDLVIFLSDSSNNKEIIFSLTEANKREIMTVLISSNYKPMATPSMLINYQYIDNQGFLTPTGSKTTQNVILDILFQLILATNPKYKKQIVKSMDLIKIWREINK